MWKGGEEEGFEGRLRLGQGASARLPKDPLVLQPQAHAVRRQHSFAVCRVKCSLAHLEQTYLTRSAVCDFRCLAQFLALLNVLPH